MDVSDILGLYVSGDSMNNTTYVIFCLSLLWYSNLYNYIYVNEVMESIIILVPQTILNMYFIPTCHFCLDPEIASGCSILSLCILCQRHHYTYLHYTDNLTDSEFT